MATLRLMVRDRRLLSSLSRRAILRTTQIEALHFLSYRTCTRRLAQLEAAGYLRRYIHEEAEHLWTLTKRGAVLAAQTRRIPVHLVRRHQVGHATAHALAVNDVLLSLGLDGEVEWQGEDFRADARVDEPEAFLEVDLGYDEFAQKIGPYSRAGSALLVVTHRVEALAEQHPYPWIGYADFERVLCDGEYASRVTQALKGLARKMKRTRSA